MIDQNWTVYIIQSKEGKLYTGITKNLELRFKAHQNKKGARFFHFSAPQEILFCEIHPNRSESSKREAAIKKLSRKKKLELISESFNKK